jgi:hypothetical protein
LGSFHVSVDRRVDPEVREVRRLEVITAALGPRLRSAEGADRGREPDAGVMISKAARSHAGIAAAFLVRL